MNFPSISLIFIEIVLNQGRIQTRRSLLHENMKMDSWGDILGAKIYSFFPYPSIPFSLVFPYFSITQAYIIPSQAWILNLGIIYYFYFSLMLNIVCDYEIYL